MPALVYTKAPFVPFTKIVSADVNQYFTDIANRINWSGGTDATTGLSETNIQSVAVAGGGLTRATKIKFGTANYVVINSGTGALSEEAQLATSRGGTGQNIDVTSFLPGDVLQVNSTSTGFEVAPSAAGQTNKIFDFYRFS